MNLPDPPCLSNGLPDSESCAASPLPTNASDPTPQTSDGLQVICIQQKRLPDAIAEAALAMAAYNQPPTLFDHQGELVKLLLAEGQPPRLMPLKPADLQCELTYAAHWFELVTDKGEKPIYPPSLLVSAMMRRLTGWAPPLRQVIGAPVFGESWRLIDAPGYDAQNQVYYHPDHAALAPGAMKAVWIGTGNNITMSAELSRRVVRCRIDAGVPQPHLRSGFRHPDLRSWAKIQRPRLLWAALTLVQNWLSSGRPDGSVTLGSYESYCRIVGGILHAAGIEGFLANLHADQRQGDEETVEWEAFISAWHEVLGEKVVGAEELDKMILSPHPEMLSLTLANASSARGRRIRLGQELRKRRGAILGGYKLSVSDRVDRHGCWRYCLWEVSPQ